ncbi:cysteine desulfurase-like protein [Streptomyces sp. MBT65]|uniref:cysteine desulfurase-like protein n=1 Tax=Streptomyces sp. MBT65 TaxID=1488395 RepID=UPI001909B504|nr:cysteine desulfurase-like protein [Streptomyces sp. MBT65]MBK3574491.1 cysteine desulfurase-like protein [Streptomyces sp. MBT65]
MAYDLTALRALFPALSGGAAHFDGPGGTQTPRPVIEAITQALANPLSNRGRITAGERNADAIVTRSRAAMADLLGADPSGIVFGRSATQLTYDFSRTLAATWSPGDEVVVTRLDHDANIRPWVQAAARVGATVRWADFDPATGELTPEHLRAVLSDRTRLVAVTAASNLIGTRPAIAELARLAHEAGALVHVDGVHYTAHALVDLGALGADFFVCSPYKFLGPHHGVLAARPELLATLRPDKLLPSSDEVPERFELGTLPYELLAGTATAVDVLAGLDTDAVGSRRERLTTSLAALHRHEETLRTRIDQGLAALDGITVHSRAAERTPTVLLTLDETFGAQGTQDASRFLAERDVYAPSGSFYAIEASRHLGLGDSGGLRIGLAPYTGTDDVDRLLTGLALFLKQGPR